MKVLLISKNDSEEGQDNAFMPQDISPQWQYVGIVKPGVDAIAAIKEFNPDLVVTNAATAIELNKPTMIEPPKEKITESREPTVIKEPTQISPTIKPQQKPARTHIITRTHQGMQRIPISEIDYFQADHKYVIAHHINGELIIEDSLISLSLELGETFIRVHRNSLVACNKIELLKKNEQERYYIKLHGRNTKLFVSRRQVANLKRRLFKKNSLATA